ncbi:hypothetical protein E2C01_017573 [Portunus trituberculatus]|uniref:Uncharacterized protein n=1 Tax=Portunus trituberculatus TaxID=210409 RepID=A0A5B7DS53_PORTR|nr:hypothetical protein [Portunus trituberculatus]
MAALAFARCSGSASSLPGLGACGGWLAVIPQPGTRGPRPGPLSPEVTPCTFPGYQFTDKFDGRVNICWGEPCVCGACLIIFSQHSND